MKRKLSRTSLAVALAAAALTLLACGQKGPLVAPSAAASAPAK